MRCTTVQTRLDAYRTGEVAARDVEAIEAHLRSCESCSAWPRVAVTLSRELRDTARGVRRLDREALFDSYDHVPTEDHGTIWVAFSSRAIRLVHRAESFAEFGNAHSRRFSRVLRPAQLPPALRDQLLEAVSGKGVRAPKVEFRPGATSLEKEVLTTLSRIPRGEVRTYEWVARKVGRPRASRAVGNICAANLVPLVVPCHRVVPSAGGIGAYVFGTASKRDLLAREGVDVDRLEQLARKNVRLIGSRTTRIACSPTCRDAQRIREENRVPFQNAANAAAAGYRPCRHCEPFAA